MKPLNLDKDKSKEIIKLFLVLLLSTAIVAFIVLLNFYYANKLEQIQARGNSNAQRISAIEDFLNKAIAEQQKQAPTQTTPATTEQK